MPANFGETLSPKELEDLVQYLSEETGGEGAAPKGKSGPEGEAPKAKPAESKSKG
jgi:hypothetical protein